MSLGDPNNDRQSEIAAETGNIYISENVRNSIEIRTVDMGFTSIESSKKCRQVLVTAADNRK